MPLPDETARAAMIEARMKDVNVVLTDEERQQILTATERYSCADLQVLVKEAAMCPVRELTQEQLMALKS